MEQGHEQELGDASSDGAPLPHLTTLRAADRGKCSSLAEHGIRLSPSRFKQPNLLKIQAVL